MRRRSNPSDPPNESDDSHWDAWREGIIGFGENSSRKSYYPELQLRTEELERFKALLNQSHDAIFLIETDSGQLCDINKTAYEMLGYRKEKMLSMTINEVIANACQQFQQTIPDFKEKFDTYLLTADKQKIPVEFSLKIVAFNSTMYTVAVARDITERIRMDAELHKLNEELEERVQQRTTELAEANAEILSLNKQLHAENLRLGAELEISRQIQQMVLPKAQELQKIKGLDIAGFMEAADEVGGDYYDVLEQDGRIKIGIGDVTGHGLESGVLMLMVQTAVQSLLISEINDSEQFLNILNRIIYNNIQRIQTDKNLTLSLLDYKEGQLRVTGQHEEILVVRQGGEVERINTVDLGFIVGIIPNIAHIVSHLDIQLSKGDGIVLYTDGITEARNPEMELYEIERLCQIISHNWHLSAEEIQQAIITDVKKYIDTQKVFDDITLLVLKQK
ncbi:SpoIIE family protein phosphatase [Candidatus Parabeggiatoa sp. HSG14]|uniref:SpoIIE family protein phosphatase n=1 Tax=Candidatus Parabeggiatoa sp. HSG14 TaxID=3055593 RepID=UPI0025A69B01|nr:SpoIIE family protein phosphatase [Thiotrichales bacterium HSG14]